MDIKTVHVPAYSAGSLYVAKGQLLDIIDVEGQQVGDLWAVDAENTSRWLSVSHTRDRLERLFPTFGQSFTDQQGFPMLEYASDTSPGRHDALYPPCDSWLFEEQGLSGHPNCRDNFTAQASKYRFDVDYVPDPINLFQNSSPSPTGEITISPAISKAGDYVTFRAIRAVQVIVSSCSVDYWPTNGEQCTPLRLRTRSAITGGAEGDRTAQLRELG